MGVFSAYRDKENWQYADVATAVLAGYVSSYDDGTIRVKQEVLRQEAAVLFANDALSTKLAYNRYAVRPDAPFTFSVSQPGLYFVAEGDAPDSDHTNIYDQVEEFYVTPDQVGQALQIDVSKLDPAKIYHLKPAYGLKGSTIHFMIAVDPQ